MKTKWTETEILNKAGCGDFYVHRYRYRDDQARRMCHRLCRENKLYLSSSSKEYEDFRRMPKNTVYHTATIKNVLWEISRDLFIVFFKADEVPAGFVRAAHRKYLCAAGGVDHVANLPGKTVGCLLRNGSLWQIRNRCDGSWVTCLKPGTKI